MSEELIRMKAKERHFLEQLLDGKKLENYKIPVPIKAELRKYQQVLTYTFILKKQYVPVRYDFMEGEELFGYWGILLVGFGEGEVFWF